MSGVSGWLGWVVGSGVGSGVGWLWLRGWVVRWKRKNKVLGRDDGLGCWSGWVGRVLCGGVWLGWLGGARFGGDFRGQRSFRIL